MNSPIEALDLVAAGAREIPELLDLVGGDPARIEAWKPKWPDEASVIQALATQREQSVRFILQRVGPARSGTGDWWRFDYIAQLRPAVERGEEEAGQWDLAMALINGRLADGGRWLHRCWRPGLSAIGSVDVGPRVFGAPGGAVLELLLVSFSILDGQA